MKNFTKKITSLIVILLGGFGLSQAQISFTNSNSVLHSEAGTLGSNANIHSGNAMCVVDVDNNGLDDIIKLDECQNVKIEYQQAGGTFTHQVIGNFSTSNCWGMSAADVDHNGYKDILFNGGSQARLMKLNSTGTGILGTIISLPNGAIFCQNGNFCDINNDGWEDIFMCNDVNESRLWVNDGAGNFPAEQNNGPYIDFDVTAGASAPNDESGNYGSVFTDFDNDGDVDLYISHCRQGQPAGDLRRYDVLFENNGSNVYTSTAASHGTIFSDTQDWTSSFGDIDNDGDFDVLLTGHEAGNTNRIFLNDGNGNFSVNAAQPAVSYGSTPQQSFMEDFDNDGWIDIILAGTSQQRIHRNNGNGTFTQVTNATLGFGAGNFLSFAAGDLNTDGLIDLYVGYGSLYNNPSGSVDDVFWRNSTSNSNNFLTLDLRGTTSSDGALGARAFIYGAWGVQTREVRASESYGTCNTFKLHFGLGTATVIDSIVINWPSGTNDLLLNETVDQTITVTEGSTCNISGVTISYSGATTFCSPDSIQLNAPVVGGYSYLWSTGETTPSIYVNSTNTYSVVCSTSPTCSATAPSVAITVDPTESVSISAGGPITFCPGASVTLTSSQATANTWSTTETSQSIVASAAGTYFTNYQGLCQSWPSNSIVVTLLDDSAPVTTDDAVIYPAVGTVTATGSAVDWYDAAVGGTLLGSGANYSPGVITNTTTYYAEDVHSYGGSTANVGQAYHTGASNYNGTGTNGHLIFDVAQNSTLNSVKVYTDTPGNRTIELRDNLGAVITSLVVNVAIDTTVINLGFALTPGTGYQLGTNTADNNTVLTFNSPQLMRSNTGVVYPYTLAGGAVTINNSSAGTGLYYYFYDWNVTVDPTDVCISARTPATITVTPGSGVDPATGLSINVYPNPTSDFVNVEFTTPESGEAMLSVFDMLGKKVYDLNLGVVDGTVIRTINTSTYAKGVYNVKLTLNEKEYNTRVVVK